MLTALGLAVLGFGFLLMLAAYRNTNPLDVLRYATDGHTTVRPIQH